MRLRRAVTRPASKPSAADNWPRAAPRCRQHSAASSTRPPPTGVLRSSRIDPPRRRRVKLRPSPRGADHSCLVEGVLSAEAAVDLVTVQAHDPRAAGTCHAVHSVPRASGLPLQPGERTHLSGVDTHLAGPCGRRTCRTHPPARLWTERSREVIGAILLRPQWHREPETLGVDRARHAHPPPTDGPRLCFAWSRRGVATCALLILVLDVFGRWRPWSTGVRGR